jgi:ribosomal-protein-alanine N-acetyltransferase
MEHLFKFKIDIDSKIILTEIIKSDRESFVSHMADGVIAASTLRMPHPYGLVEADEWIKTNEDSIDETGRPGCYAIREKDSLKLIGCIGYDGRIDFDHKRVEIGYWLAPSQHGKGVMTKAVKGLCRYLFDDLKLNKVIAYTFADNIASQKVLQKSGFVKEGHHKEHYVKNNSFKDAHVYSLLSRS